MGLIKAAAGAGGGVLADQWKEYFYCDAINADVLAVKGRKKVTKRSSNTKGDEDIITSGSVIAVADGQAMMIVDQGKVVEAAFEPGEFVYDSSAEPTIFAGSFGDSVCKMFANMAKRFTFGGEAPRTQRVYYFNTKELTGNKYGTASPVPFRVLDERAGIDMDIGLRCFGEYSYRIVNPMLFYTNVCGNMAEEYRRENLDSQLKSELLTALQPAFARIGANGVRCWRCPRIRWRSQTRSTNSFRPSGVSCAASRSCRSVSTRSRQTRRTKRPSRKCSARLPTAIRPVRQARSCTRRPRR